MVDGQSACVRVEVRGIVSLVFANGEAQIWGAGVVNVVG